MRVPLLVVGVLALTASAATTPALDLHGTARAGARIRIPGGFTAQIAGGHQWRQQIQRNRTAFDVSLTSSLRRDVETPRP
jgi:hypothetical protein